jgi:hypothetical protein
MRQSKAAFTATILCLLLALCAFASGVFPPFGRTFAVFSFGVAAFAFAFAASGFLFLTSRFFASATGEKDGSGFASFDTATAPGTRLARSGAFPFALTTLGGLFAVLVFLGARFLNAPFQDSPVFSASLMFASAFFGVVFAFGFAFAFGFGTDRAGFFHRVFFSRTEVRREEPVQP